MSEKTRKARFQAQIPVSLTKQCPRATGSANTGIEARVRSIDNEVIVKFDSGVDGEDVIRIELNGKILYYGSPGFWES